MRFQKQVGDGRVTGVLVTMCVALAMQLAPTQLRANSLPIDDGAAQTLQERWLATHNAERARVGVAPLKWDDRLASNAQKWANHLAQTRTFDHAPTVPADDEGENLWMGTAHSYAAEEMVDAWVDERKDFKFAIFPNVSRTGRWQDVGHYAQLIWHNTTRVGCAVAEGGGDEYLVCRYDPPGNWDGQSPLGESR
jgi:Cysteine-rich secretory protein family